ncbi:hypothetical protein LTR78_004815 [Recurvomyces mirabilis]|uniref:Uncharacterized protein n=1 Tax=Recurvomyces mirabilis TaxID=574656 RepID=A0AAE1C272_9PEZI|nr:hypothetical protein LTR78_004815 [Recurvomyces mirabilis]
MAEDQGVELKPADILIVRSGFTKWCEAASQEERDSKIANADFWKLEWTGVEGSPKTVEWLWNHHFAAVAGDSISWEQWPFNPDWEIHQYQLAMLGSPIGEIWDLERLAVVCEEQRR